MTPLEFHQYMMMLSDRYGFRVTSYYRSARANNLPGIQGHIDSRHMLWLAMDIIMDDPFDADKLKSECSRQDLIAVDEGDHIHIQAR